MRLLCVHNVLSIFVYVKLTIVFVLTVVLNLDQQICKDVDSPSIYRAVCKYYSFCIHKHLCVWIVRYVYTTTVYTMVLTLDGTVCPGSSAPFFIVSYYIKWVTTSWTHSSSEHVAHVWSKKGLFRKKSDYSTLSM